MTRQEVHRFLYGNDNDEDEIVLGEGFLGILKQSFEETGAIMGFVASDLVYNTDETEGREFYTCILPYYFINSLANYVLDAIDLNSQFVSEFFDEVCVFTSNDGSIIYTGTFYELLIAVTFFTEIYCVNDNIFPAIWEEFYNPRLRYVGQCGDYEGRALFFDADWYQYTMIVFAPMIAGAFNGMPFDDEFNIPLPSVAFNTGMFNPYFDCDELCPGHDGVGIFGVSDATPTGVQTEVGAIAMYESSIL